MIYLRTELVLLNILNHCWTLIWSRERRYDQSRSLSWQVESGTETRMTLLIIFCCPMLCLSRFSQNRQSHKSPNLRYQVLSKAIVQLHTKDKTSSRAIQATQWPPCLKAIKNDSPTFNKSRSKIKKHLLEKLPNHILEKHQNYCCCCYFCR